MPSHDKGEVMKSKIYIYIVVIVMLGFISNGSAQEIVRTNPADRLDARTLLINPAIIPYQNVAFNFGMVIYQYGFLEGNAAGIRYSYNTNSYPDLFGSGLGVGVTVQNLTSPYFNKTGIGFSLGYMLNQYFSLGLTTRLQNHNFAEENMDLVDENDPLFANGTAQWNGSLDVGLVVNPGENFCFGLSFNNINRPDLSLANDGARLPLELNFGGKYYYKKVAFSLFGHYIDEQLAVGVLGEVNLKDKVMFRAGYSGAERSLTFESQFNLYKGIALTYRLDYPLYEVSNFSMGSHQLGLSWNMRYNPMYAFHVKASVDTVYVIKEKTIIRISREAVNDSVFAILDPADLVFPSDNEQLQLENRDVGLPFDDFEEDTTFSKSLDLFKNNFDDLKQYLDDSGKRLRVAIHYTDALTAERAFLLKRYFIDSLKFEPADVQIVEEKGSLISDSLKQAIQDSVLDFLALADTSFFQGQYMDISAPPRESLVPEKIIFSISNVRTRRVSKWRILITDFLGKKVHEISGYHNIEDYVEWDGFTSEGRLLKTGNYYYQFQYSLGGKRWIPKKPKRRHLVFERIDRERILEIRRNKIDDFNLLKNIVIRLKNPEQVEEQMNQ